MVFFLLMGHVGRQKTENLPILNYLVLAHSGRNKINISSAARGRTCQESLQNSRHWWARYPLKIVNFCHLSNCPSVKMSSTHNLLLWHFQHCLIFLNVTRAERLTKSCIMFLSDGTAVVHLTKVRSSQITKLLQIEKFWYCVVVKYWPSFKSGGHYYSGL